MHRPRLANRKRITWHARREWILAEAEAHARQAGRLLELLVEDEPQRAARILFRAASRLRTDRHEVAS